MVDKTALKTAAKLRIAKAGFWRVVGMTLFLTVAANIVSLIVQMRLPDYSEIVEYDQLVEYVKSLSGIIPPVAWVIIAVYSLFSTVISVSYSYVCLKTARGERPVFSDMFEAFGYFIKAIAIELLLLVMVTVSLLPVALPMAAMVWCELNGMPELAILMLYLLPAAMFPAFLVSVTYSQTRFVLVDELETSLFGVFRKSRLLMKGAKRKLDFFLLQLSYIGWHVLSSFIVVAGLWVTPYVEVGSALYYDYLSGRQTFHLRRRESGEFEFYAGSSENNPFDKKGEENKENTDSGDSNE